MKKILSLALLLSVTASAFAVEAEIDGLWYELISKAKEATVIHYKNSVQYSGNIVIPEKVEYDGAYYSVTSIGDRAFAGCSGLTSVTIPNNVTSIGDDAFSYCSSLTSVTIPNNVKSIGEYAFYKCSSLTSVTIPNSVTSIGDVAFQYCDCLTSVYISDIAAWCKISFSESSSNPLSYAHHLYLEEEEITNLVIPNNVTSIGNYAFENCSGLTSVTIPNSVTSIGYAAFGGCSGLTSVTIPNSVTSIGHSAFLSCSGLISVTISNRVKSLENWTFEYCSSLTSVTIPNSVTSIGWRAFEGCSGLTSVTIPNSVTSIGDRAFEGCSGLTTISIGSGTKNIGSQAFAKCLELTDVNCYAEKVPSMMQTSYPYNPCTDAFLDSYINYATLHVPTSSIDAYKAVEPWASFKTIMGLDGTMPEEPETKKCATPTISIVDGELEFSCETEDVEYVSEVTSEEVKTYYDSKLKILGTYTVSVYATKAGYDNSDVVTKEFTVGAGGEVCDVNRDGTVDVADIGTIIDKMAGK